MWMLEKRRGTGFKDREVSSPQPGEEPATPINIWGRGELVNQAWCPVGGGAGVSECSGRVESDLQSGAKSGRY